MTAGENSKFLAWSSVRMAFEKAMDQQGAIFTAPKELIDGTGRELHFYPVMEFWDDLSAEEVEKKLKGNRK